MILELKEIHTYYGTSHVIFGLSLHVNHRDMVGLLGRNGAGKTTTLRSIIGITPPRTGSIRFLGHEVVGKPPYYISQLGIGFIPDNRRIFPDLTVRDNLEIAIKKRIFSENEWTLERVYELFPPLKTLEKRKGQHLSGGEQQMLAIGRALMGNPSLLLMDEPTQGLAPMLVQHLLEQVSRLREEGVAVLLSEQNVAFTTRLGHRLYIIDNGTIQFEGTSKELEENQGIRENTCWLKARQLTVCQNSFVKSDNCSSLRVVGGEKSFWSEGELYVINVLKYNLKPAINHRGHREIC